jgi:hypothetical protein
MGADLQGHHGNRPREASPTRPCARVPMRVGSPNRQCAVFTGGPDGGGSPGAVGRPAPKRMGNNPTRPLPRRLAVRGGFTVDDGRSRHLDQQASRLGFADLRGCLQTLLDDGWSIPRSPSISTAPQTAIRRAITDHNVHRPPRRQELARQRQRAAQQRGAARVAGFGFPSVWAYLVDRLVTQVWTLAQVQGELGAAPATMRRLLDQHEIGRGAPTRRPRVSGATASGPRT